MFSSVPQSAPLRSRAVGIILGTIIMVGVPIMIMSAKTVQITLPLLFVGACASALSRREWNRLVPRCDGAWLAIGAFILYAMSSGLWSPNAAVPLKEGLIAAGILAGSLVLIELMRTQPRADALHMGEGLWIGLLVGVLYMTVEAASDQVLKIWAYNLVGLGPEDLSPKRYYTWANGVLVAVHSDDLTRNIVPAPLLLWPALMTASVIASRAWRVAAVAALVLLSGIAVFLATSETTKLALLAGLLVLGGARFAEPIVRLGLAAAWTVACLGVVPAVYLARYFELQNAPWLQLSAQLRITLWNELAEKVPEAPWLGVGANMTYESTPVMQEAPEAVASWAGATTIPHPHNVYLQTWYELGLVGAVLLMLVGFTLLRNAGRLDPRLRPYALAMFATAAVQIAFSYSMWQIWFLCLFGFVMAMFTLGQVVLKPVDKNERASLRH